MDRKHIPSYATAITTVSWRRQTTFPRTVQSLKAAGFTETRIFVDGDRDIASWEREFGLETTVRTPTKGQRYAVRTYGNWILSLAEIYIRNPNCDRYAIFQDDFVTYKNLKDYLDSIPYPAPNISKGYWNLYTFPENQQRCPKIDGKDRIGWYESNQLGRGAVALIFNRDTVQTLLQHQHMIHKPAGATERRWQTVDGAVVQSLSLSGLGYKEYVHNPSLVQHIGIHSAMGHMPFPTASSFRGEDFDARELITENKTATTNSSTQKWKIVDRLGRTTFCIEITPSGPRKSHTPQVHGTIETIPVGDNGDNDLTITWSDGWKDILRTRNGETVKSAYHRGDNWTKPMNVQKAIREF
jgi:hypothetical protein